MLNQVKAVIVKLLRRLPGMGDWLDDRFGFERTANACRGVYGSFADASAAAPKRLPTGYDHAGLHSHILQAEPDPLKIWQFNPMDYPVLVWLARAFEDSSRLFDLGGGNSYDYQVYKRYIRYPEKLSWTICDVPEAVKVGQALLGRIPSPGLQFTADPSAAAGADIFLTCGTLQYLEGSLADFLQANGAAPRHLIVHHVPFYDGPDYITLQNLWGSYAPYKIRNRQQFIGEITALGYDLVDAWNLPRQLSIPFHKDKTVQAYQGFYFRKKA